MEENLKDLWPLYVKPKDGELLTSWMIRNAHNHQQKVYTFYRKHINNSVKDRSKIWGIDLDRNPREDILAMMSKHSGLSIKEVYQTSLKFYEGKLFEKITQKGNSKWILPQGHYHSKNMRHSLLYCPGCLSNDTVPYYRMKWRLSLSFCCPICNLMLRETCWNCGAGVNFIRTDLGLKNELNLNKISECNKCGSDLRRAKAQVCRAEDIYLQTILYSYIDSGSTNTLNYSHLFFDAFYHVCSIVLSSNKKSFAFQYRLAKESQVVFKPILDDNELNFDFLETRIRRDVITMAYFLLDDWPERFLRIMRETSSGMYVQFLNCSDKSKLPYWYTSVNFTPGPFQKSVRISKLV